MKKSKKEIEKIMNDAREHCTKRGARLTPIREQVLELVIAYHDVVKAYDILTELQKIRGGQAAPPTVYRALEFLVDMGILHRTESLNGFVLCPDFTHEHISVIINCRDCGKTEEIPADRPVTELLNFCAEKGFSLSHEPIVLMGHCTDCQNLDDDI